VSEQEWLACKKAMPMLEFLRGKASQRKLRLFAVACIRATGLGFQGGGEDKALRLAECIADGLDDSASRPSDWHSLRWLSCLFHEESQTAAEESVGEAVRLLAGSLGGEPRWMDEWGYILQEQANRLRDIFGNPFRHLPAVNSSWVRCKDGTITKLAQSIYDDCNFTDLPILADALEQAGCTNQDILNHCRQCENHARGCWVLDLLLGKK
jgi:hypothetical protein